MRERAPPDASRRSIDAKSDGDLPPFASRGSVERVDAAARLGVCANDDCFPTNRSSPSIQRSKKTIA
jgi:hypothetical protein